MIPVVKKIPKKKVMKAVDKVYKVLKKELGKDVLLHAFAIKMMFNAIKDQEAIEKIMLPEDLTGEDVFERDKKINRCRQIVEGMLRSELNFILFRDEYDVWMQYYMGLFLEKDTLIFALKEEKEQVMPRIALGGLVKSIDFVDNFGTEETHKLIMKRLKEIREKLK